MSLNPPNVQAQIGSISQEHSPKTVKNTYGRLSAALESYVPEKKAFRKASAGRKEKTYVPTDEEIKELMNYLKNYNKDMYIACNLAAFGTMRRSKICALGAKDVKGNVISVNKAMVLSADGEWIIKTGSGFTTYGIIRPASYTLSGFRMFT